MFFFRSYLQQARVETKKILQSTIINYYSSSNDTNAVTLMWDHMMTEMNCCGVNDYMDFGNSENWNNEKGNNIVPRACCLRKQVDGLYILTDNSCPIDPSDSNSNFRKVSNPVCRTFIKTE